MKVYVVPIDYNNNIQGCACARGGREDPDKVETKRECENGMNQREALGPTHVQHYSPTLSSIELWDNYHMSHNNNNNNKNKATSSRE